MLACSGIESIQKKYSMNSDMICVKVDDCEYEYLVDDFIETKIRPRVVSAAYAGRRHISVEFTKVPEWFNNVLINKLKNSGYNVYINHYKFYNLLIVCWE